MLDEIIWIVALILTNGIFSMSEMAIVSARKTRLQQLAETGNVRARAALNLAESPNQFFSTVQIGITLVGILTGAFGGATIAEYLAAQIGLIPVLKPYSESIALGAVVLVITYLSLVLGELVPKRLALNMPERIAMVIAGPMRGISFLTAPVVFLLSASTELMVRTMGVRISEEPPVTEDELRMMLDLGTQAGVFEASEQDMVNNIFELNDRRVSMVMTPHPEIVWIDIESTEEEIRQVLTEHSYSRFPVGQGDLDNLLGIVRAKDLLVRSLAGYPLDLKSSLRTPLFVPESMPVAKVLELFKTSHIHIAFVIDEYGSTQGLVTLKDILEAIAGDVTPGTTFGAEPQAVQREDGSWLLEGMLAIDEFKSLFHLDSLPEEEHENYQTLAGFIMSYTGRIPTTGDFIEWNHLRLEVVDMDGRRIDKLLVKPLPDDPAPEPKSPRGNMRL